MPRTALGMFVAYAATALVFRVLLQHHRTKDFGVRLPRHRVEWIAAIPGLLGGPACLLAPIAEMAGLAAPFHLPFHLFAWPYLQGMGVALAAAGVALTVIAQLQMRDSWRIGVDENEKTALVTTGLFASMRNPIFTGLVSFAIGTFFMVPNALSLTGVVGLILGIEIQVRCVEEPYLARVHGNLYLSYMQRAGRFLPGIGRGSRS